jgi:hypothetical protein
MKRVASLLLLVAVMLTGCKTSKRLFKPEAVTPHYLSSKLQLTLTGRMGSFVVNGTMKMESGTCVQVSLLMPILRTEVARLEATPDEILLVDRMNRRFVRATREELRERLRTNVDFARLEKLLEEASLPGGKRELSGADFGIPAALAGSKVLLYDFSTKELSLSLTQLSAQYRQLPLDEFISLLKSKL